MKQITRTGKEAFQFGFLAIFAFLAIYRLPDQGGNVMTVTRFLKIDSGVMALTARAAHEAHNSPVIGPSNVMYVTLPGYGIPRRVLRSLSDSRFCSLLEQ
jgi:hypothetical protein